MYKNLKKEAITVYYFTLFVFFALFISIFSLSGCLEDEIFVPQSDPLIFSVDTMRFDTVFTSLGSATRSVRVYNPSDNNISIGNVRFRQGIMSKFRMNVDGIPSPSVNEVEIRGKDSIYIFVEVTIDPNEPLSISPFVITDAIVFESEGRQQEVVLEAWGQNANYIPERLRSGQLARLSCENNTVVWDDPKPYVIYGILFIDSCTLEWPAGTRIYVHGGLAQLEGFVINDGAVFFQKNGILKSEGTTDRPVVIQGDRLENEFSDVPGQWTGLRFLAESKGHIVKNTIVKNSIVGIRADSATNATIDKSQFFNTSNAGIIGIHSNLTITNSLFYRNGASSLIFAYGGNYDVNFSTLANYENQEPAILMNNFFCRDANCQTVAINPLVVSVVNSIIMGSNDDEILFVDATQGAEQDVLLFSFENCIVKIDELETDQLFLESCDNCISATLQDSLFVNPSEYNYRLHEMSVARGQGKPFVEISDDLEGNLRNMLNPDIGCYEFQL